MCFSSKKKDPGRKGEKRPRSSVQFPPQGGEGGARAGEISPKQAHTHSQVNTPIFFVKRFKVLNPFPNKQPGRIN